MKRRGRRSEKRTVAEKIILETEIGVLTTLVFFLVLLILWRVFGI